MARTVFLIPSSFVKKLFVVNQIRVYFSHPNTYENEIRNIKKPANFLNALNTLTSAFEAMNAHIDEEVYLRKKWLLSSN